MLHNADRASEILLAEIEKINVCILIIIEHNFVYKTFFSLYYRMFKKVVACCYN